MVGGWTNGPNDDMTFLNTIYRYNPDEDSWILLNARMSENKYDVLAIMLDRKYVLDQITYQNKTKARQLDKV